MYAADRIGRKFSGNCWYSHKSEGSLPNHTPKLLEGLVSLSSVLSAYHKIEVIAITRVSTLLLRLSPWIAAMLKNRMDLYGLSFLPLPGANRSVSSRRVLICNRGKQICGQMNHRELQPRLLFQARTSNARKPSLRLRKVWGLRALSSFLRRAAAASVAGEW